MDMAETALPVETSPSDREITNTEAVEIAADTASAIEHYSVTVESEQVSVRLQRTDTDGILIEAQSIFTHLKDKVSVEGAVLSVLRSQDGAKMTLDMSDGTVRANGILLGALPEWEARDTATTWLTPNAIAVLSGCTFTEDEAKGYVFTLDERLRPNYDLDLWVNGERVSTTGREPRTIGPVLLVPLEPIVESLGHILEYDEASSEVTVTRIQDSAVIMLNVSTGLVTVNGTPRGVSPNMSYADPRTLLLPFSAIETLTGTHIVLEPGTSKIEVRLDDRLAGAALPGERVIDESAATGFTPERLDFQINDRGTSTAEFSSRYRGYNTRMRYETTGGLTNGAELQPSWVSLDVQALDGWRATLGDTATQFRELSGIDQNRIRGVSFRKRRANGVIVAIAAGVPVTGAETVSDTASRPVFGGVAGGIRLIDREKQQEAGISASRSEDGRTSRLVIGGQKVIDEGLDGKGLANVFLAGDVGLFSANGGTELDVRGRAEARYNISEQVSVQAIASYDGERFTNGATPVRDTAGLQGVFSDNLGARTVGTVSADWRAVKDWGALTNVAAGTRVSFVSDGVTNSTSVSASTSARIGAEGPDISIDIATSEGASNNMASATQAVNVRAFKRFDWGNVQAGYTHIETDGVVDERLVANVIINPIRKSLGDGATATIGPAVSAVWTPETSFARLGANAVIESGNRLGDRLTARVQVSALQSIDPRNSKTDLFANISARYDVTNRIALETSYYDDLRGRNDFRIGLRGSVLFNPPRRHTRPVEGTGILKGRVFFDRNRDGIRQEDEPGIPGIRVQVRSTRLGLKVDRDGFYTIQNMKTGLYSLMIDRRSLPLGMLVAEDEEPKVTIGDGRITIADIPVIASGQIRGAVFEDLNGNSKADPGEVRLVGALLTLERLGPDEPDTNQLTVRAAAFGQYSFENLSPGEYSLTARADRHTITRIVTITEDNLFVVTPMAIASDNAEIAEPEIDIDVVPPDFTA